MSLPIQPGVRPLEFTRALPQAADRLRPGTPQSPSTPIDGPGRARSPEGPSPSNGADATGGASFGETLSEFVQDVNSAQVHAESKAQDFANGHSDDIHGTMIAMQEADVKLRLLGNVRNRALEAYREIMRMGA